MLMATLLLGVPAHFCSPQFLSSNGLACATCPTLPDAMGASLKLSLSPPHSDCHDCCALDVCHDEGPSTASALAPAAPHVDFVVLASVLGEISLPVVSSDALIPHLEGCPPTGPPSDSASRGPPFFQLA